MEVKKVLNVRRYKAGYEVRKEIWNNGPGEDTEMRAAYNPDGDYIGSPANARHLVVKRGIQPVKRTRCSNVCSIGYSVKDGKWYGWSHRAIFGFKVGSKCKKGDCHYRPKNKDDFRDDTREFWKSEYHKKTYAVYKTRGILVTWMWNDKAPNKEIHGKIDSIFTPYPDSFGRGAWTAKTTADAKRMAMDFAEGVS